MSDERYSMQDVMDNLGYVSRQGVYKRLDSLKKKGVLVPERYGSGGVRYFLKEDVDMMRRG